MNKTLLIQRIGSSLLLALACSGGNLQGQPGPRDNMSADENILRVLSSLRHYPARGPVQGPQAQAGEAPRVNRDTNGVVRHLSAMPGHAFQPAQVVPGQPGETARQFVRDNKAMLGIVSPHIDVHPYRERTAGNRQFVRLQQTYKALPVFAAQMAVQLIENSGIEYLSSDLSLELNDKDAEPDWTTPTISGADAIGVAAEQVSAQVPGIAFETTPPQLMIHAPSVFDLEGAARLVWEFSLSSDRHADVNAQWMISAHSGEIVARYAETHSALDRQIRDSNNTTNWPGTLVRSEGDPASGIADVDNGYLFIGQAYNWYNNLHGRDSYDGAGSTLNFTVRYCPNSTNCPWGNAQWVSGSQRMRFGQGYTTDDVVGHELTHGVTDFTSDLVYENQSGAINESLSDVFGEFIDLNNANGNDADNVRWLIGEDIPGGWIRDMAFPTNANDPDRLTSSFYVAAVPAGTGTTGNDFGGVHSNSGVNNKLCYLLVDGDTFNGQTITGMGIVAIADLYYQANANLLTSGSGWADLYEALRQTAVNIGWTVSQRNNLERACRAVEIASPNSLYVDGSSLCLLETGIQNCLGIVGPFKTVTLGVNMAMPGDTLNVRAGSYNEALTISEIMTLNSYDGAAVIGQ